MKKWMEQFRVEDWVVVWVSIPLLALAAIVPAGLPKVPATLLGAAAWSNIACLFAVVLAVLYAGCLLLRRPLRGLLAVARGGFRRLAAGADRQPRSPPCRITASNRSSSRCSSGLLIRNVWRGPGVAETGDSGRILHQDRRRVPRCHDPLQRRDEVGRLRSGAGVPGGRRRVVLRLSGCRAA